jgi:hypothetical protein
VTVFNTQVSTRTTVDTAFFDPGSHRSYITQQLADQLALEALGSERLSVSTFNDEAVKNLM